MIVATNHSVFERPRGAGGHRRPRQSRLPSRGSLETRSAPPRSSPTRTRSPHCGRKPRPRHRRRGNDRQRRRSPPLGDPDFEVRVSDQRPAPDSMREGCEVHTGDLRDPEQARTSLRGCSHVIHLAAIVGGIANFHLLPTRSPRSTTRSTTGSSGPRSTSASSASPTSRRAWCSSAPSSSRPPRSTWPVRRRGRRTGGRSWPARCTAARRTTSSGCRSRSAGRSTPTGRARCRRPSPASRTPCPTCCASRWTAAAAADLRLRRANAHAHARGRRRRQDRHRHRAPGHPQRGLQHLGGRGADRGRDRAHLLGAAGNDPADFELEHLPSFAVDVQRRWPSVDKAERLLGWRPASACTRHHGHGEVGRSR